MCGFSSLEKKHKIVKQVNPIGCGDLFIFTRRGRKKLTIYNEIFLVFFSQIENLAVFFFNTYVIARARKSYPLDFWNF